MGRNYNRVQAPYCNHLSKLLSSNFCPCVAYVATRVHKESLEGVTILRSVPFLPNIDRTPPKKDRLTLLIATVRATEKVLSSVSNFMIKRAVQWLD